MAKEPEAKPAEGTAPVAAAPAAPPAEAPSAPRPLQPQGGGKAADPDAPKKKKKPGVPPRRGKKLRAHRRNIVKKVDDAGQLAVKAAVALLKSVKRAKFDETVEIHMNLGIDPTQSDQMVRGTVSLPHGIGKSVRVAVFCQGANVEKAKAAGADFVGGTDLVDRVQKENFLDFDIAITTQDLMPQVAKLGKVLGPRGLMPTPKAGTVVPVTGDLAAVVKEFKAGKVEYRSDKTGQIHAGVGKISFADDKIAENILAFVEAVRGAKPAGIRGNYINGVVLSATMCPGIRITV